MNNKILWPLAAIALAIIAVGFAIVSVAVFFTKGKSKFLINKKLKLGGLMLTLTSMMGCGSIGTGCQQTCYEPVEPPQMTCYDVVMVNVVRLEQDTIKMDGDLILKGTIHESKFDNYSFSVVKVTDTLQHGKLKIVEKDTANTQKKFEINLDKKLTEGNYTLIIYADTTDNELSNNFFCITK